MSVERGVEHQDVPQQQGDETSSIGGLWPPEQASYSRIKAIYNEPVEQQSQLDDILERFNTHSLSTATRIQYRMVVESSLTHSDHPIWNYAEASMRLDQGTTALYDPVLVYLGKNAPNRQSHGRDLASLEQNVYFAEKDQIRPLEQIFSRVALNGYEVAVLSHLERNNPNTLQQMFSLYQRFGWNEQQIGELLENESNLIAVGRHRDRIVSAGLAELGVVPIGEHQLNIAEITEAATLRAHQRNGLYTAVSTQLLLELVEQDLDLIFGECNGLAPGVLRTAQIQGRTLATSHRGKLPGTGILHQQVPIEGPAKHAKYNDLVPAYLTGSQLRHLYGEK